VVHIDATDWELDVGKEREESAAEYRGKLGRLVNFGAREKNLRPKFIVFRGEEMLVLVATSPIAAGDELLYDYSPGWRPKGKDFDWMKTS